MEHLDRCVRNVQRAKPPYHKPFYMSNLISNKRDYTPNLPICQTFLFKNLYKMQQNVQKYIKKN